MKELKLNKILDQSTSISNNLKKRNYHDVSFENWNENESKSLILEHPKQFTDDFNIFPNNVNKNIFKNNSPIPSVLNEYSKNKDSYQFEFPNKFSQRSILIQDQKFMNESIKDEMAFTPNMKAGFKMNDNIPLNNSCSSLENEFWKNKVLTEKDYSCVEDYGDKFDDKKCLNEKLSAHQKIIIDDGFSEIGVHKNPNIYKGLKSISYSIYDKSVSQIRKNSNCYNGENSNLNKNNKILKKNENISNPIITNNQNIFINQQNPRLLKSTGNKKPISDRIILSISNPALFTNKIQTNNKNVTPISFNVLNQNKLFQHSEKIIQVNEEMIKNKFKIQNQMSKFNNGKLNIDNITFNQFFTENVNNLSNDHKKESKTNNKIIKNLFQESFKDDSLIDNEIIKLQEMIENYILSIDQKQFKKYKNLLAILISLFVIGDINEIYFDLTEEELQILQIIMFRKFKKNIEIK